MLVIEQWCTLEHYYDYFQYQFLYIVWTCEKANSLLWAAFFHRNDSTSITRLRVKKKHKKTMFLNQNCAVQGENDFSSNMITFSQTLIKQYTNPYVQNYNNLQIIVKQMLTLPNMYIYSRYDLAHYLLRESNYDHSFPPDTSIYINISIFCLI
jgi:hypothetical protein